MVGKGEGGTVGGGTVEGGTVGGGTVGRGPGTGGHWAGAQATAIRHSTSPQSPPRPWRPPLDLITKRQICWPRPAPPGALWSVSAIDQPEPQADHPLLPSHATPTPVCVSSSSPLLVTWVCRPWQVYKASHPGGGKALQVWGEKALLRSPKYGRFPSEWQLTISVFMTATLRASELCR